MSEDYKRKTDADVSDKQLKNISIGDYVRVVTYGRVCELRDGYSYDQMPCGCAVTSSEESKKKKKMEKKKYPARITVEVEKVTVEETEGAKGVPPDDSEDE